MRNGRRSNPNNVYEMNNYNDNVFDSEDMNEAERKSNRANLKNA